MDRLEKEGKKEVETDSIVTDYWILKAVIYPRVYQSVA